MAGLRISLGAAVLALGLAASAQAGARTLLNVSYDPTRELYKDVNAAFAADWKKTHPGDDVVINQSHGGSGKQARAVIDGLQADVVTLALANDIDEIAERGKLLPPDWQKKLPDNSSPYTSTIVFLVRKGNPKGIHDWNDLVKPGVSLVTPNPKTGGAPRWAYLAGWGYALRKSNGSEQAAQDFIGKLYKNVAVLDTGSRGSTTTFAQRGIGDVLITWENEAWLTLQQFGADNYQIVYPSISILAEPSVAVVDVNAARHGTANVANAYLKFLYTPQGQELAAKHFYRPRDPKILAKYASQFPKLELLQIDRDFGGWKKAQATHFADGGIFDQIYAR